MQSPNPYPQQSQAYPYSQQPQPNPYPQRPQPNPYPQQSQAYPYPQQPQTQDYITRNWTGKHFWFVSRPDNNGCNFALLCYSIFAVPVFFLGRYYVKFEGKKSSTSGAMITVGTRVAHNSMRATTVTRVTTFYRTPLVLKEILLIYFFLFFLFFATIAPFAIICIFPLLLLSVNVMVLGIGMFIWMFIPVMVLSSMYEKYTGTGKRLLQRKK